MNEQRDEQRDPSARREAWWLVAVEVLVVVLLVVLWVVLRAVDWTRWL